MKNTFVLNSSCPFSIKTKSELLLYVTYLQLQLNLTYCCLSSGKLIDSESVKAFYQMMGIHCLSECLDVRVVTEMYVPCHPLQKYMHDVIGYIQRILVREYPEIYATLQKKQTGVVLAAMNFVKVNIIIHYVES